MELIKQRLLFVAMLWLTLPAAAVTLDDGPRITRQQYIAQWKDVAIDQMHKYGIPASIKLAQGILESADGNSMLARQANNHFGVKCHGWSGPGVYKDDDKRNECFRKYRSAQESFEDHSEFLMKQRYAFLFHYKTTDYKSWAHGLKKAGYATNPKYPQLLIRIIEENKLYEFDREPKKGRVADRKTDRYEEPTGSNEIDFHVGRKELITDNGVHFVFAKSGDTYRRIADEFGLRDWQLAKYNDADKGRSLQADERVYLKPKRGRGTAKTHVVRAGETLRDVSQLHAIKLKRLERFNGFSAETPLKEGQQVKLRK